MTYQMRYLNPLSVVFVPFCGMWAASLVPANGLA